MLLPFRRSSSTLSAFARRAWEVEALLREELRAIRQTLDMPPEALSGLTRNGLLAAHGLRLRQLERWLWPFYTAREIKRLIA